MINTATSNLYLVGFLAAIPIFYCQSADSFMGFALCSFGFAVNGAGFAVGNALLRIISKRTLAVWPWEFLVRETSGSYYYLGARPTILRNGMEWNGMDGSNNILCIKDNQSLLRKKIRLLFLLKRLEFMIWNCLCLVLVSLSQLIPIL